MESKKSNRPTHKSNRPTLIGKRKADKNLDIDIYQITVDTWNIGHLSSGNKDINNKKQCILKLLDRKPKIDLLVIQEVNEFDKTFDSCFLDTIQKLGYSADKGIEFKTGSTQYTSQKQSAQYEYYVLFYLKDKFALDDIICNEIKIYEEANKNVSLDKKEERSKSAVIDQYKYLGDRSIIIREKDCYELVYHAQQCEWTPYRPVLVRKLSLLGSNRSILLGTVHTSPSYDVVLTSKEYVKGMIQISQLLDNIPWILAGDWYVQDGEKIDTEGKKTIKEENDWSKFLKERSCLLLNPLYTENRTATGPDINSIDIKKQTNFPKNGEGMIADYFIVSKDFSEEITTFVLVPNYILSQGDAKHKSEEVYKIWYSDHAPVITHLSISPLRLFQANASLSQAKSVFPQFSYDLTYAMSDEPILLNGMKVLFDNPTPTTPVTLQPKQKGTNNGR